MNSQEAIKTLEHAKTYNFMGHDKICEAIDEGIKALEFRTPKKPFFDTVGDYETGELKRYMLGGLKLAIKADIYTRDSIEQAKVVTDGFIKDIDEQPTIEAEPVRYGHWIRKSHWCVSCSCCGKYTHDYEGEVKLYNYCPNCGAKMDGKENDNK